MNAKASTILYDLYRNNPTRQTLTYDDATWDEPFECMLSRWQLCALFEKLDREQQNTVQDLLCMLSGWVPERVGHNEPPGCIYNARLNPHRAADRTGSVESGNC